MHFARLAVAAAVLFPLLARAGVVIEGKGKKQEATRFVMDGQKLRMDSTGERGADGEGRERDSIIVFDGAAKKMTQIDRAKGVYTEMTQADVDAMSAMTRQAQAQHGAPKPDAKAWSIRYEKTGKSDSALGKSCDVYRMVHGQQREHDSEICVAPFGAFGVEKGDFAPFRAFGEFVSQMGGGKGAERSWADIPGVPLVGWDVEGGERRESFRATKVEKRSVPASEFAVPAGLKKGPSVGEQMKQMQQQMQEHMTPEMQRQMQEYMKSQKQPGQ